MPLRLTGELIRLNGLTNVVDLLGKLGLIPASWLDFCLSRPLEMRLWLCVHSSLHGTKDASLTKAHPNSRLRSGARHEGPRETPMEMFLYGILKDHYSRNGSVPKSAQYSQQYLFCDEEGNTVMVRVFDMELQPFSSLAAEKHPNLLFAHDSPFFPIVDVVTYSPDEKIGLLLTSTPPWTFSNSLLPAALSPGAELRRVLERARDLYRHLAILERHGVSMDGRRPLNNWPVSLTHATFGPFLMPSYIATLNKTGKPNRFTRGGVLEEQLPVPPSTAWPLPSTAKITTAAIPWSSFSAYHDPRVAGPTTVSVGRTARE